MKPFLLTGTRLCGRVTSLCRLGDHEFRSGQIVGKRAKEHSFLKVGCLFALQDLRSVRWAKAMRLCQVNPDQQASDRRRDCLTLRISLSYLIVY